MAEDVCYYAGEEYSDGSIIEVDGELQQCRDDDGYMSWDDVQEAKKRSGGITAAPKKSGTCSYDGKTYSIGAKLKMPNGTMYQCVNRPGNKTGWTPA